MNNQADKFKKRMGTAVLAIALCLSLVTGMATAPVSAATPTYKSPFNSKSYSLNSKFNGNLIVNGVDVSYWQSTKCNWTKAKTAGVDYTILRVTYTNYGPKALKLNTDSHFETNFKNARAAGVMTGVYVFSQAKNVTEAIQEADYAVARLKALGIGPKDLQLPVYMDYEFAGGRLGRMYGISKTNATNAAVAFCNRIKSYGYTPGVYANLLFFRNTMDPSKLASDVDLWVAQYNSSCGSTTNYSKWQYASNAKINGVLSTITGAKGSTDVNFWFLNKSVNSKPLTVIKGKTTLSVADAKSPKFTITNGKTTLKEGTDYVIGGIRNTAKGSGYAYVKGIGKYGGYALVPIKVADKTSGSASTNLNSKCANYLTYASTAKSTYIGNVSTSTSSNVATTGYKKGSVYTVKEALNVRKGASTSKARVKRSKLNSYAKKVTYSQTYAVLKPGTQVKVTKVSGNWIKVKVKVSGKWKTLSGGWICGKSGSEVYVN